MKPANPSPGHLLSGLVRLSAHFVSVAGVADALPEVTDTTCPGIGGVFAGRAWADIAVTTEMPSITADSAPYGAAIRTFLSTPSSANLAAAVSDETGTGALVFQTSPAFITPNLGNATGASVTTSFQQYITGLGKHGYDTGAGGTVTQATSKATAVTLDKPTGTITMNNAALAAATTVTFLLNSLVIEANDIVVLNHISGGTAGAYTLNAQCLAGQANINVRNITAGSLSEAIVLRYAVIKSSNA